MGQPTMSTQSPQTGGKSGQYGQPGQPSGKGMAGGLMNAAAQQMPQQMPGIPLTADQMPQQADGNNQMGAPLPPVGSPMQPINGQGSAGGKGMAGMAANGIQAGMGQGNVTYPSQSGQPMMGMPNQYSNTVGRPNGLSEEGSMYKGGKGTGGSSYGSNA